MKLNVHLRKLLRISVSPESSYPEMEIGLFNLTRIIRSTSSKEVARGAVKKILVLFYSKNRMAKTLSLRYLSRVDKYVEEVDTNIVHMFHSTDGMTNDLGVRFVKMFSRFFRDNDIIFYHVYRSKSRHREEAVRSMISSSPKYYGYGKELGNCDSIDMFKNIDASHPEEYFGRLKLPELVELVCMYPCLIKYFKFTSEFLIGETKKTERYHPKVLKKLRRILGIQERNTMWDVFLECAASIRSGRFVESMVLLKDIHESGISTKYKTMFSIIARSLSDHLSTESPACNVSESYVISTLLEAEMCGLTGNRVYRVLRKLVGIGLRKLSKSS